MRRIAVTALAALAVSASAGLASADVTDVLVVPSVGGLLTLSGASVGTAASPLGAAGAAIGATTSVPGGVLTVSDLRGLTGSSGAWHVTASYASLSSLGITAPTLPAGLPVGAPLADIGGANVSVTPSTALTAATNAVTGVANPTLGGGALSSPVSVASAATDGRGLTAFSTSYAISIPAKAAASVAYTGAVVYTVSSGL
jgi:hypothetical protein